MSGTVYINKISKFLPNNPIQNDDLEEYIGFVGGKKSRSKAIVLRNNGIKSRYYAMKKGGEPTHTNAQLVKEAIHGLFDKTFSAKDIDLLACGTTSPDQIAPSHAVMVHGLLQNTRNIEVASFQGVCCSGMSALKYGYMSVSSGFSKNAVVCGSERIASWMRADNFNEEDKKLQELEQNPVLAFEKDFLRWMLSDGAGAFLLESQPSQNNTALKIEWIEMMSFANEAETCMYAGGEKYEGQLKGWTDHPSSEWLPKSLFSLKQDVRILDKNITAYGGKAYAEAMAKHQIKPEDIDYFLPHISSMYFAEKVYEEMVKNNNVIPKEKWFINLTKIGNVGAGSIFIALEELVSTGQLKKGQKILLSVPESARFSYAHVLLTVN